jgi:hypothetical protein
LMLTRNTLPLMIFDWRQSTMVPPPPEC